MNAAKRAEYDKADRALLRRMKAFDCKKAWVTRAIALGMLSPRGGDGTRERRQRTSLKRMRVYNALWDLGLDAVGKYATFDLIKGKAGMSPYELGQLLSAMSQSGHVARNPAGSITGEKWNVGFTEKGLAAYLADVEHYVTAAMTGAEA